jgi:hypothetical protein
VHVVHAGAHIVHVMLLRKNPGWHESQSVDLMGHVPQIAGQGLHDMPDCLKLSKQLLQVEKSVHMLHP